MAVKQKQKYKKKIIGSRRLFQCRNPGLNQGPLDLQSNALPTELFRLPRKCEQLVLSFHLVIYIFKRFSDLFILLYP